MTQTLIAAYCSTSRNGAGHYVRQCGQRPKGRCTGEDRLAARAAWKGKSGRRAGSAGIAREDALNPQKC
jgi:hypothetical protein